MKLTVPVQTPGRDPELDVRPRPLRDWLDGLPYLDPVRSAALARGYLQRLNRQPLPPAQRMELLEALAGAYHRLLDPLLKQAETVLGATDREQLLQALQRLCQDLAFGYKIALNDALASGPRLVGRNRPTYVAALLSLQWLGQHLLHRYASYQRCPLSLWREVDQIFRYAVARRFHQEPLPGRTGQRITLEGAFKTVAMLRLGDPYRLEQGSVWEAHRYLECHAQEAELSPWSEDHEEPGLFYLAPTTQGLEGYRHGLALDVRPLMHSIAEQLPGLRKGQPLEPLGFSPSLRRLEAERLLERLHRGWNRQVARKAERQGLHGTADLAVGLENVFYFLNRGVPFDRHAYLDPGEEQEIDLGNEALRWDPARETVVRALPCQTLDRSAGGMALRCHEPRFRAPRVGQLIAVRSTSPSAADQGVWYIAVGRWLVQTQTEEFELGVQYLARDAVPIAIRPMVHERAAGEYQAALRAELQQPTRRWRILFSPTGLYRPGRYLDMVQAGKRTRVRCERLLETGWSFERFSYEPVED